MPFLAYLKWELGSSDFSYMFCLATLDVQRCPQMIRDVQETTQVVLCPSYHADLDLPLL